MKEITKMRSVCYTVYQTSDGKEFEDKELAQLHEDVVTDKKKTCTECNGKGHINEKYVEESFLQPGEHFATGKHQVLKFDTCPTCKGKKYLELKWI